MTLAGRTILVTRGEEQGEIFSALIRERGGVPVLFPTIRLVPPEDPGPLDGAIARLSSFDWILFASANAARFFCERAARAGITAPPEGVRVASVGPGTGRELARRGFPVHLTAEKHTAEGLVDALRRFGIAGRRFLLPRALEGREAIQEEIAREGGSVETVAAYRNGLPERDERAARNIVATPPDVCTFASPSAFRNFFRLLGEGPAAEVLSRSLIAVIGEVTARAVSEKNFAVDIMPEKYTLERMLDAIEARLSAEPSHGGPTT
ncbi:MAG: uroporphyrinogen-III synthase [Deltaproteobacteria bacterium]|nr:uroporphyrinogen-III synthase [Deltaproteobacteria bacterium]